MLAEQSEEIGKCLHQRFLFEERGALLQFCMFSRLQYSLESANQFSLLSIIGKSPSMLYERPAVQPENFNGSLPVIRKSD